MAARVAYGKCVKQSKRTYVRTFLAQVLYNWGRETRKSLLKFQVKSREREGGRAREGGAEGEREVETLKVVEVKSLASSSM